MGTGIERLKALVISRALKRDYYADGGGLYLQVSANGNKSWAFRYRVRSPDPTKRRLREMGLGSYNVVTLAEARETARACRRQLFDGVDPIDGRKQARNVVSLTFEQCGPAALNAILREEITMPGQSSDLLVKERKSIGTVPYVLLRSDPTKSQGSAELDMVGLQMHLETMDLSSDAQLQIVPGSGHNIQSEKPGAGIAAVTDLVWKIRRAGRYRRWAIWKP